MDCIVDFQQPRLNDLSRLAYTLVLCTSSLSLMRKIAFTSPCMNIRTVFTLSAMCSYTLIELVPDLN